MPNIWNTIVYTRNASSKTATLYVNGQYYGTCASDADGIDARLQFGGYINTVTSGYFGPQALYDRELSATEATAIHEQLLTLVHFEYTDLQVTSNSTSLQAACGKYTLISGNIADGSAIWQNENGYYLYNLAKNSSYDTSWVIGNNLNIFDYYEATFYSNNLIGNYTSNEWDPETDSAPTAQVKWFTGETSESEPEDPTESEPDNPVEPEPEDPVEPEPDNPITPGTGTNLIVSNASEPYVNGTYSLISGSANDTTGYWENTNTASNFRIFYDTTWIIHDAGSTNNSPVPPNSAFAYKQYTADPVTGTYTIGSMRIRRCTGC